MSLSSAQIAANRANAQFSTGPTSSEGKAKVSLNAVKTALTGCTVLLPTDDAAEYERFLRAYQEEFQPVGQRECDLVQSIADTVWRLRRIPGLEIAIYTRGRVEFAGEFEEYDPALRDSMIDLTTYNAYEKQLRNLHLQEARLARRREKETGELRALQQERKAKEAEKTEVIQNGSEFSTSWEQNREHKGADRNRPETEPQPKEAVLVGQDDILQADRQSSSAGSRGLILELTLPLSD